jgi:CRISPR-associated endonuclease/helicase Cas3
MISEQMQDFADKFRAITGFDPYKWQSVVYENMLQGRFNDLKLPTGTGKTSVMVIWLLALAKCAEQPKKWFPRRLVWVVDRRTVVDQATAQAEEIRKRLEQPSLAPLKKTLNGLSATDSEGVLAVSTLRGELADNGEWKKDPSKPAIIVGTVDMVGSRLLFPGYGDGRWHRPLHAGLLGTDVLFVLDEAHLSAPFSHLIRKVAELNRPESIRE